MDASEAAKVLEHDGETDVITPLEKEPYKVWGAGEKETEPLSDEEFQQFWDNLENEAPHDDEASESEKRSADEETAEPTFEEQVDKLLAVVNNKASHKEILRKTLVFCKTQRSLSDVEAEIQTYPEYRSAAQNPYRLISYLVDGEGIDQIEIDENGLEVNDERKVGLTDDEVDDLVVGYELHTTVVGEEVADRLAPQKRIKQLLSLMPDRYDTYVELLQFCREPQTFEAIESLFSGRDFSVFTSLNTGSSVAIKPSVFIDKLERTGGIVWKNGWTITAEGKAFLEEALMENAR